MKHLPSYIKQLGKVALLLLAFMSLTRGLLLWLTVFTASVTLPHSAKDMAWAFLFGLRFDAVITAYVMMLPFLVLGLYSFFSRPGKAVVRGVMVYFIMVCMLLAFIFCADVPYFLQFGSRLSTAALLWISNGRYILKMITAEWTFLIYLLLFVLLSVAIFLFFIKWGRKFLAQPSHQTHFSKSRRLLINVLSFLILGCILLITARGSLSKKSPIRIGTAYFCNDQLLNKIVNNPVFTFGFSVLEDIYGSDKIQLMDEKQALSLSDAYLSMPVNDSSLIKCREQWQQEQGSGIIKNNIVIILMEGMGTYKMGKYNGPKDLTPELNQLISRSVYFDNIYSAGIHTFNGIYSTLFSFPAIYKQQPLEKYMDVPHRGLATVLKEQGYTTSYFTTHDPQFDNVAGFLKANDYQNIYSDYPAEWILSNNGIPDHKLFEYAIPVLNKQSASAKPFFAVFMTASDHKPYIIPLGIDFRPKSTGLDHQIIEYADWSIGHFLEMASQQSWYQHTTFVLIADHGLNMGHTYDMPLSYHSVPLIIFTPSSKVSDTLHCLGGQIDVAPTVLGMLHIPNDNKTLGLDLFQHYRPFMYFSADDRIGCLDKEYYLIIRPENNETLFQYKDLSTENFLSSQKARADSMRSYTFSMMQTMQLLMSTKPKPAKE